MYFLDNRVKIIIIIITDHRELVIYSPLRIELIHSLRNLLINITTIF